MNDILKIGCPRCGAILSVKNQIGIESKSIQCPVCNNILNYTQFKKIGAPKITEKSQGINDAHTRYNDGGNHCFILGRLNVPKLNLSFQLKPGSNVIGRKSPTSSAQIQIPCDTSRMSREHLVIEIKKDQNKGFVHCASLYKEKVNPTYVDNVRLEYGDCVVLKNGAVIQLPDMEVEFIIPDTERTEF